jgi:hypothetical protein
MEHREPELYGKSAMFHAKAQGKINGRKWKADNLCGHFPSRAFA